MNQICHAHDSNFCMSCIKHTSIFMKYGHIYLVPSVFSSPILFWWLWQYLYIILSSLNHNINHKLVLTVRSWNNGMQCMSCYVLIKMLDVTLKSAYQQISRLHYVSLYNIILIKIISINNLTLPSHHPPILAVAHSVWWQLSQQPYEGPQGRLHLADKDWPMIT